MVCLKMPDILLRSWNKSYPVQTLCQARIQLPFMTEDMLLIVAVLRMVLHCLFITVLIDASFCATSFFESLPKNLVSGSSPLAQIYFHFFFLTHVFHVSNAVTSRFYSGQFPVTPFKILHFTE